MHTAGFTHKKNLILIWCTSLILLGCTKQPLVLPNNFNLAALNEEQVMYQAKCKVHIRFGSLNHAGNCMLQADNNAFKLEIFSPIGTTVFNLYANKNWLKQQKPKPEKKLENNTENRLQLLGTDITPKEIQAILWGLETTNTPKLNWEFEAGLPKLVHKNGLVQIVRVEFKQWFEYQNQQLPKQILINAESSHEDVKIVLVITEFSPEKNKVQSF